MLSMNDYGKFLYDKQDEIYTVLDSNDAPIASGTITELLAELSTGNFEFNSSFKAIVFEEYGDYCNYPSELYYNRNIAMDVVQYYGYDIEYLPDEFKLDREFAVEAIISINETNSLTKQSAMEYIDESFKNDREFVLSLIREASPDTIALNWNDFSDEIKNDKYVLYSILYKDIEGHNSFAHLPDVFKDNKYIAITAIEHNPNLLQYASDRLKDDKEVVLTALKQDSTTFYYASDRLKNDREMVEYAVTRNGWTLGYTSKELQDDKDLVMKAIKSNVLSLRFASDRLKDDIDVVTTAVKDNQNAILDASERIQNNPSLLIETLIEETAFGNFIDYKDNTYGVIDNCWQKDQEINIVARGTVEELIDKFLNNEFEFCDSFNGILFTEFEDYHRYPEELRENKELTLRNIEGANYSLTETPANLMNDKEIVMGLIKVSDSYGDHEAAEILIDYISPGLLKDKEIVKALVNLSDGFCDIEGKINALEKVKSNSLEIKDKPMSLDDKLKQASSMRNENNNTSKEVKNKDLEI